MSTCKNGIIISVLDFSVFHLLYILVHAWKSPGATGYSQERQVVVHRGPDACSCGPGAWAG